MSCKEYKVGWLFVMTLSLWVMASALKAQSPTVITLNEVLDIVRKFHPVAQQANLGVDSAKAVKLSVRGAFDPSFYVQNQQKTFDGKNYYFYTNTELKIPTWYGVEIKTGLEDNGGDRLDLSLTPGRSSYTGISVPLLKNLLLDKRRAALEQSNILIKQSEAERSLAYNNLLFDAAETYWSWVKEYQSVKVIQNAIAVSQQRLEFVRKSFLGGDRAAIDTVEAWTQLQGFELLESDFVYRFTNTGFELSNFLWLNNKVPYSLPAYIIPDTTWNLVNVQGYALPVLEDALIEARDNHPKLRSISYKVESLQVDRRLKFQNLLPTLNVNYNFLNNGYGLLKGIGQNVFENNYKYGFEFGVPLFLRQARGEYKLSKIKIEQTHLQQSQTTLEIENKVRSYYNEMLAYRQQVKILEDAYQNFIKLQRAEELKFSIGESSLFLVNSREMKSLETLQKLLETKTKFFKSLVAVQWATGRM